MNFVADESLDGAVIRAVGAIGHQVLSIIETEPGISDLAVLDRAFAGHAILMTEDKDFGELVYRRGLPHFGVVLVRLDGCPSDEKAGIVINAIAAPGHDLDLAFCVIDQQDGADSQESSALTEGLYFDVSKRNHKSRTRLSSPRKLERRLTAVASSIIKATLV